MPTRIGLISDTHVAQPGDQLPPEVFAAFADVDIILHAGDIYAPRVLRTLEQIAPVYAAQGNGDVYWDRHFVADVAAGAGYSFKKHHLLCIEDVRIALIHYFPAPADEPYVDLARYMATRFPARPDVVVCGDTHVEQVLTHKDILIVNPGSPTLPHQQMGKLGTVGILVVDGNTASADIVHLATHSLRTPCP